MLLMLDPDVIVNPRCQNPIIRMPSPFGCNRKAGSARLHQSPVGFVRFEPAESTPARTTKFSSRRLRMNCGGNEGQDCLFNMSRQLWPGGDDLGPSCKKVAT